MLSEEYKRAAFLLKKKKLKISLSIKINSTRGALGRPARTKFSQGKWRWKWWVGRQLALQPVCSAASTSQLEKEENEGCGDCSDDGNVSADSFAVAERKKSSTITVNLSVNILRSPAGAEIADQLHLSYPGQFLFILPFHKCNLLCQINYLTHS